MVTTGQNRLEMLHPVPDSDELREIRELNQLFLTLLQGRARAGADCLGLAAPIARELRDVSPAVIDGVSRFPRALFALKLRCAQPAHAIVELPQDDLARARHALALTALLSAWHMSRKRSFQARMFLGLSIHDTRFLRTQPLSAIQLAAWDPELLSCGFPTVQRLWRTLLRFADEGLPADVQLIGLQPQLDDEAELAARASSPSAGLLG